LEEIPVYQYLPPQDFAADMPNSQRIVEVVTSGLQIFFNICRFSKGSEGIVKVSIMPIRSV